LGLHVQVSTRLLHSVMPLQVPVATADAASSRLEADVLLQGLLLAHLREQQVAPCACSATCMLLHHPCMAHITRQADQAS
jgi:hypothetical protein